MLFDGQFYSRTETHSWPADSINIVVTHGQTSLPAIKGLPPRAMIGWTTFLVSRCKTGRMSFRTKSPRMFMGMVLITAGWIRTRSKFHQLFRWGKGSGGQKICEGFGVERGLTSNRASGRGRGQESNTIIRLSSRIWYPGLSFVREANFTKIVRFQWIYKEEFENSVSNIPYVGRTKSIIFWNWDLPQCHLIVSIQYCITKTPLLLNSFVSSHQLLWRKHDITIGF